MIDVTHMFRVMIQYMVSNMCRAGVEPVVLLPDLEPSKLEEESVFSPHNPQQPVVDLSVDDMDSDAIPVSQPSTPPAEPISPETLASNSPEHAEPIYPTPLSQRPDLDGRARYLTPSDTRTASI